MWERSVIVQNKLAEHFEEWVKKRKAKRKARYKDVTPPPIESLVKARNWALTAICCFLSFFSFQCMSHQLTWVEPNCPLFLPPGVTCPSTAPWFVGLGWYPFFLSVYGIPLIGVLDYIIWKRGGSSILEY